MSTKSKTSSVASSNKSSQSDELVTSKSEDNIDLIDESAPKPRLCHLKKWPNFQGYGFNLHAERTRQGQHIGKVDANSPAESAGLREGDRIIEVNYVNISNENHQQVVKRIRNGLETNGVVNENEVVLLVVDSVADDYFKKLNIIVKNDFPNVLRLSTIDKQTIETINNDSTDNNKTLDSMSKSTLSNLSSNANHNETININNNTNSDSTTNLNEIRSVNSSNNDEQKLDNSIMTTKQNESTSSASNISVNSSDNHSKSSKSNAPTPSSQKKDTSFSNRPDANTTITNPNSPVITTSTPTTPKTHLISGAIDPFHENINYNFDKAYKTVCEMFEKSSLSTNSALTESSSIYSSNTTGNFNIGHKTPPRRPPPPSASATVNFKKLLNSYKSNRSSYYFDCNINNNLSSNRLINDKKSLDTYLEMSAAEFKNYLKSKSRNDPRIAPVDMKQKFQMFQDM